MNAIPDDAAQASKVNHNNRPTHARGQKCLDGHIGDISFLMSVTVSVFGSEIIRSCRARLRQVSDPASCIVGCVLVTLWQILRGFSSSPRICSSFAVLGGALFSCTGDSKRACAVACFGLALLGDLGFWLF